MRRLLLALLLAGCEDPRPGGVAPAATGSATPAAASAGSRLVAATGRVAFPEGTVVSTDAEQVTFEHGTADPATGKRPQKTVDRARAWEAGAVADAKVDEALVCNMAAQSWHPCRVKAVNGGKLTVIDHLGTEQELASAAVVRPDAATQKTFGDFLVVEARRQLFDEAFERAGRPARPDGWKPRVGDELVVHYVGTSWYGAKVIEVHEDKGKVRVTWDGGTWDDRDVAILDVAPRPRAAGALKDGQYVLARPEGPPFRWPHARVESVRGETVLIVDRDDKKRSVVAADLLPIVPR
jgi:hypothetical protein